MTVKIVTDSTSDITAELAVKSGALLLVLGGDCTQIVAMLTGARRYYKHIGLYGYSRAALALFHSLPQSPLELAEKLEQLRYLENGIAVHVAETPFDTVGVDTAADLKQAAALLTAGS